MNVSTRQYTPSESAAYEHAVLTIEKIVHATLLAVFMQDDRGVFITLRPGDERAIARALAECDMRLAVRFAEEFGQ